jgi:hypothetical protein
MKALISNWEMKGDQFQSNKMKGKLRNVRLAQLYWLCHFNSDFKFVTIFKQRNKDTTTFSSKLAIDHNRHLVNGEIMYMLLYSISYMAILPVDHGRLCLNSQFSIRPKFRPDREQSTKYNDQQR